MRRRPWRFHTPLDRRDFVRALVRLRKCQRERQDANKGRGECKSDTLHGDLPADLAASGYGRLVDARANLNQSQQRSCYKPNPSQQRRLSSE
jgi:hypothetical protein